MIFGHFSAPVVRQPTRSRSSTAWAPLPTWRAISSMWSCIASVSAKGSARAAPTPLAGHIAPKSQALS
jgi:hypothetical protein